MLNLTRLVLGIAHESQFQGLGISSLFRMATRVAKSLAGVSSHQPKRIGDCLSAGWSEHRQRLETLIGAGPFLIRASRTCLIDGGKGRDDERSPRRLGGGGGAARASGPGGPPRQYRGQADRVGGRGAP